MEVESWFLAENTFLQRMHPSLTLDEINKQTGVDLNVVHVEDIDQPASLLHNILGIAGLTYNKVKEDVQSVVDQLDYGEIYFTLPATVGSLK